MKRLRDAVGLACLAVLLAGQVSWPPAARAAALAGAPKETRVGIVTFLSGPASGPFGIPARNAAEVWASRGSSA